MTVAVLSNSTRLPLSGTGVLMLFIFVLLASNIPIHLAYSQACNSYSQRNAYRWLPRLLFAFSNSKALLPQALLLPTINSSKHLTQHFKSQRLLLINPSFQLFIQAWGPYFIAAFQRHFFA